MSSQGNGGVKEMCKKQSWVVADLCFEVLPINTLKRTLSIKIGLMLCVPGDAGLRLWLFDMLNESWGEGDKYLAGQVVQVQLLGVRLALCVDSIWTEPRS